MFQQTGFLSIVQALMIGSVLVAGVAGKDERYRRIVEKVATAMVTFGPMTMLLYVLYSVSRLG